MLLKDFHDLKGGLNKDDGPAQLPQGDYTEALNIRALGSDEQHGAGPGETLQGEVPVVINPDTLIYYGGQSIGGSFLYSGFDFVTIGTQTWMKKNYDVNYPGSRPYNDDDINIATYGRLYTYNQIMSPDFCPLGWRVPTEADIDILLTYLGGEMIAGGKMKEYGTDHWDAPNTGADDSSGFRALPAGKFDLLFSLLGSEGIIWLQDDAEPDIPIALPATEVDYLSFKANWTAVNPVTGYYLDVAEDAAFTLFLAGYNNKAVGNVLFETIAGLTVGTPYYYRVRSENEIGISQNSNTATVTTLTELQDKDGNVYNSVIIGEQEWLVQNLKVTTYADGTPIPLIADESASFDYFLPSLDELQEMYNELHLYGVGNFDATGTGYWSSSEGNVLPATYAQVIDFSDGNTYQSLKSNTTATHIRACRVFTSSTVYYLRTTGPGGGLIFHIINNGGGSYTYYEAALTDQTDNEAWSNIINSAIGTTGEGIGTGQPNTNAIIAQASHTYSAAQVCDNYSNINLLTDWTNDGTYPMNTLTTATKDIISAVYNGASFGMCHSNEIAVEGSIMEFGTLYFTFFLDVKSGTVPMVHLYKNGVRQSSYTFSHTNPQSHTIGVLIAENATYGFGFSNEHAGDALDFEVTVIAMYPADISQWVTDTVGAYCWYDNDISYKAARGALYNQHAVNNAHGLAYLERNSVQESGWRVPTAHDWLELIAALGGDVVAGGKLKEIGTSRWADPNEGATDEYGFTAVPSGQRNGMDGSFSSITEAVWFWMQGEVYSYAAEYISAYLLGWINGAAYGLSVRLVRDISVSESTQYFDILKEGDSKGSGDFRIGVRDGGLCYDQALTSTGFDGIENVDWINYKKIP